jgi:acyl-CoA synthetase (NDP forming)
MLTKVEAVRQMLAARSVAVVGASSNPGKFGYALFDTIRRSGYCGTLYPINRKEDQVQGVRAFPSIGAVPGPVDLALILVPAPYVPAVLREAAAKGTRVAAVLSAGFGESGFPDREDELRRVAQECGIRILGPNIQGFAYLPNKLCAMFWPALSRPGSLGVIAQSGSVTSALAEWAVEEGLGISAAFNLGNQVDLGAADLLEFFAQDNHTRAVALHLEAVKDGRRFLEVAQRVARAKPVVVLKSGRTEEGRRSAASHTGSLAGRDEIFGAACRQAGLLRANDLQALYDNSKALATMHRPGGNRLLVASTSGGGATLAVDEAQDLGLVLPPLPEPLIEELRQLDPPTNACLSNPLDLPSLDASLFERAITLADRYDLADVCLICFGDPVPGSVEVVQRLARRIRPSLAVAFFGGGEVERASKLPLHEAGVPVYPTPERAVRAIAATVQHAHQCRQAGPPLTRSNED